MSLIDDVKQLNIPEFRKKQIFQAKFHNLILDVDKINIDQKSKELLKNLSYNSLDYISEVTSTKANTVKYLLARKSDKLRIETVLIKHSDGRNTVCLSCMIGCPVNCAFCATGKMGFKGNLSADEIIDQYIILAAKLKEINQKITNIVYMGMGEPLLNLKSVQESIDVFCDENFIGLSPRRITISTSGYIPQFIQLIDSGYRGNIALSLHAAIAHKREKLMPIAKVYTLDKLIEAMDYYTQKTNRRVTYEYILIDEFNMFDEDVFALKQLLKNKLAHVNLIPYNPVNGIDFRRPSKTKVLEFHKKLLDNNINATVRVTMGDDQNSACGQLVVNNETNV